MPLSGTLLIAASLAGMPQAATTFSDVLVTAVSRRPPPSGVMASFVAIKGNLPDGKPVIVYVPYMIQGQPLPSVSSRCTFMVHLQTVSMGPVQAFAVDSFTCTITSDSPSIAAAKGELVPFWWFEAQK